jgi:hypothetical protein
MTVFLTVISSTLTFVLGQLVLKLLIDPVQEFKRNVADIALALIEYANIYANPGVASSEVEKKISEELRRLSSRLNAQLYLIPCYPLVSKIFGLPAKNKVVDAASNLIGLSNGVFYSTSDLDIVSVNLERADKIRNALGILIPESDRH